MGLFSIDRFASHFPSVEGTFLDGSALSIPSDLTSDATLLVVSFKDGLDLLTDQWIRLGERLSDVYESRVSTFALSVHRSARKLLDELAALAVEPTLESDEHAARTVNLYVDRKAFQAELGCTDSSEVYTYLVASDGRIAWRGKGTISLTEVGDIEAALQQLLASLNAPSADRAATG